MGLYSDEFEPRPTRQGWLRWTVVIVVSALVGSGATLAMLPILQHSGLVSLAMSAASDTSIPASTQESPPTSLQGSSASSLQGSSATAAPVNVNVSDGIVTAVKKVEPAVMGVVNYSQVSDFFSQQTKVEATGVGTGVLISKDGRNGYVVTNNHVVEGAAKVEVVLGEGKHVKASVVGTDRYTDLAVLKVGASQVKTITPVEFANSNEIEVGEPAIAIGTPMGLDFADSVTAGIVSAKKRIMPVEEPQTQQTLDYQAVIQTDAAINPGNSGGPLIDIDGKVIGINSSKIVAPNFEGMGFSIPSNEVRIITQQIMTTGHAVHPAIGISAYSLSTLPEQWWPDVPVDYGVWVKSVTSAETKASGLKPQDVIIGIDGHDVRTMADLRTYLFEEKPGQVVTLRVYRGHQQLNLKVKVGKMQSDNSAMQGTPDTSGDGNGAADPFSVPNWFGN